MENQFNSDLKERFTKLYIRSITNNDEMTTRIMSYLYPESSKYKFIKCKNGHFYKINTLECPHCSKETVIDVVGDYKSDKHKEIVESLNYLKSKPIKTKQDRESIHTLEIVLKNFS